MKKQIVLVTSLMLLSCCNTTQCDDRCAGCLAFGNSVLAMICGLNALHEYNAWEHCHYRAIDDPCGAPYHTVPMVALSTATLCFSGMAACFAKKVLKED